MLNNQLSSSQINETLLNAMKTIAQKEVQNLEFDVTEKYTILRKDKDSQGKTCYIIEANGSEWEVYASNDKEYYPNDIVLINIPKNILTEKKYIIGLAEKAISKYYLPSSNFIPIATLKDNQPNLLTGYESGFLSFEAEFYPEQFLLCDTIYLKFDIKTTKDILEDYQFSIILNYGEGYRTQEYSFASNLFTGNINSIYYSTQDISFDNILNFNKIQNIVLKISTEAANPKELLQYIKLRNLEFSIGKTASAQNTGIEIIPIKNSLSYNLDEDDFTRKLGLIWYNRNEEGDFIGFDTNMKIPLNENKEPIWSAVMANEYEYTQEKNAWNKKKELYDLEYCPYDLQGLQYIQDIGEAEIIFYNITDIISAAGTSMYNYISNLTTIYEKMLQIADINKITDTSDKNLVNIIYSNLLNSWSEFQLKLLTKKEEFFDIVQTVKESYNFWSNYIGQMFLNVRKMQEIEMDLDIDKLQLQQLIYNNQELNFSDIIEYIYTKLSELSLYYEKMQGYIYTDFNTFNQAFLDYENSLMSAGVMSGQDTQKLGVLKAQILDLTQETQNIIKTEKIDKIYQIFTDNNYISYLNLELTPPSYWYNSTYINPDNYTEIIGKYYNDYYYQYQYYIKNQSFIDEEERLPNSLVIKQNAFNPIFVYSKQEQEDRDQDGEPDDTIAIYWYQENIKQENEDILLQETGWDLISTNTFQDYFPTYRISGNYAYLNKADPFNNMIEITLPENIATTTVKVLLYYNHQQVGNAELTFINEQYEDIGFENSLLDIEYDTERHSISNNEGFSINVTCYDKENAREIIEPAQVLISEKKNLKIKKFPTLLIQKQGLFNHTRCYTFNKNAISSQKFTIENYKSEKYFIPYGIISFSLYSDEEDVDTSYLPLSWSPNSKELSLQGTKMISIKSDGSIEYDKYNANSNNPLPYSLIGEKNIKITDCVVEYIDNKLKISNGQTTVKKTDGTNEEILGNALTVQQQASGEYILNINNDANQIRTCLKNFRPYLKISGTFGEQNENDFVFYQSLFILHENYNYHTFKFDDEISVPPTPIFTFIDPREEALVKDIAEQTKNGEIGYSFLGTGVVTDKEWAAAKKALQHILNNSNQTIIDAYNFYFEVVRVSENSRGVVPDKKWYEERLLQLNNKKEKLGDSKTVTVYNRQTENIKNTTQSIGSWIADLFRELLNFHDATETDQKNFLSALELRYTDLQAILKLIKEDEK